MIETKKIVIGAVIFVVAGLLLVFLGVLPGLKHGRPAPFTLEMWGIHDTEDVWRNIIQPFQKANSHITIRYTRFPEETYENTFIERMAENTGPDIFMLENSRLAKHREKIFPFPQQTLGISLNSFAGAFIDMAVEDLVLQDGNIYGMPLYADSLALFYNKDIFNAEGIAKPPQNWDEIGSLSRKLTRISPAGDVARSGVALGSGKNITHAFEIISALILQNGDRIVDPVSNKVAMGKASQDALAFYSSFADRTRQNFSWSNLLPSSLDAFAEEKTAMVFGFSSDSARIKAKNPHINLGLAPFPQLANTAKPVTYGEYTFLTVSKFSQHPVAAWNFALFAVAKPQAMIYTDLTSLPPARRDILALQAPPLASELFWRQALIAKAWRVPDYQRAKKLFEDTAESLSTRSANPSQAFNQVKEQLQLLLP